MTTIVTCLAVYMMIGLVVRVATDNSGNTYHAASKLTKECAAWPKTVKDKFYSYRNRR